MLTELWIAQRYLRTTQKVISFTGLISVLGVAVGVMVLIVVIAVMSGFDRYLQDKMIGTNAHLLLEFYKGTKEPDALAQRLKKIPHILATAPFVDGEALIKQGTQIMGVEMRGIDPQLQPRVTKIKEYLRMGSLDVQGNEIVLGEELALRLGLGLEDKLVLISPVTLTPADFKVKGIFNSGMYLYDSSLVLTSIKAAQDFYKLEGAVSGIGIKIDDIYKVDFVKEEIYRDFNDAGIFEARTWVDANRNFLNALKLEKIVMFIVVTMTTVVAAFGIISTLMMSVMTRFKDIGILRSTGAQAKSILQIFIFQGITIGITGIILGVFSGIGLALSLNNIIDFISRIIGRSLIPKDIYYFDRIPTYFNRTDIGVIVLSALAISFLASIYPAYYAVRINPAEAVRHE
ncbi:MAG: hypothetical protein A2984_03475 [Omnitrophica WOR_2 bacterium RIFCSPLOWO2_01_FULL_41_12]|nr:MAG: hypothetical protein A2984_03475 [Omnitrophica WOR_2 bacterium RIFCSPLOWO2_01_FULL_41_12]